MEHSNESSARDLIKRLVDSIGARDERGVVPFVLAWPQIVGSDLAAHTKVLDIRNGAVLVGVDHPGWLQRLHLEQNRIIGMIRRRFPSLEVRYMHFTVVERLDQTETGPGVVIDGGTSGGEYGGAESWREDPGANEFAGDEPAEKNQEKSPSAQSASDDAGSAEEDHELQRYLEGLERALKQKETGGNKGKKKNS